jgi:acyl-lipid omega-3 desaturase
MTMLQTRYRKVACVALSLMVATSAFQASTPPRSRATIPTDQATELQQSSAVLDGMTTTRAPPRQTDRSFGVNYQKANQDIPALGSIARMLPKEVFEVSTKESLMYFGLDLAAVTACMTALYTVVTSDVYHGLPIWQQGLMVAPLQVLTGFAMWCMWCIGHDAGHGTVSKSKPWVNRLVGEIAHSVVCLTPFVPWAKSHLKHHLNHNHLERDFSHQWFIREEKDELPAWFLMAYELRNLQLPFLYLIYLLFGIPDGGHVYFYGRMWQGEPFKEKMNASISSLVSLATAGTLCNFMGFADFTVVCMVPWLVISFWLFMVTYLQHHSDDGVLYTDDTWDFTRGAFETVDRDYGTWINRMSHHMMDGHVAHHLFFTKM